MVGIIGEMRFNVEIEKKRWCYACGKVKPLVPKYWSWANKEHTRFRTKCRACTNFDSKISHRIHYEERKQRALLKKQECQNATTIKNL